MIMLKCHLALQNQVEILVLNLKDATSSTLSKACFARVSGK